MNIKETFLRLTQYTYPHGTEFKLKSFFPGAQTDSAGNFFLKVGDSRTMFTAHLDTACGYHKKVTHVIDGNLIRTDGTSILGADDKAGVTVLLWMIKNKIPGLYYFFVGEEVGCVGSRAATILDFSGYDRCISFDRRGYDSVITHQLYGRCCSQSFAQELANQLNKTKYLDYAPDPTGIVTDSASFVDIIRECTNISVGYFNEHTNKESQDITFLTSLCESVLKVDWESLPVSRNFVDRDYDFMSRFGPSEDEWVEIDFSEERNRPNQQPTVDMWIGSHLYRCRINSNRILEERSLIYDWVFKSGSFSPSEFSGIEWDSKDCYVTHKDGSKEYLGSRDDLAHVIDQLMHVDIKDIVIIDTLK